MEIGAGLPIMTAALWTDLLLKSVDYKVMLLVFFSLEMSTSTTRDGSYFNTAVGERF